MYAMGVEVASNPSPSLQSLNDHIQRLPTSESTDMNSFAWKLKGWE
jgi:hypothetical protein